jgi:Holliday junction resolvase-like predicted endonuclease
LSANDVAMKRWVTAGRDDVGMDSRPPGRMRTRAQQAGDAAEETAAAHLVAAGWTILARNIRIGRRELDLVTIDPGPPAALVIVEVRWRGDRGFGLPEETIGHRKREGLRAATFGLLDLGRLPDGSRLPRLPVRIDLIGIEPGGLLRHHRAAV